MCGIYAIIRSTEPTPSEVDTHHRAMKTMKHRGPDASRFMWMSSPHGTTSVGLGFHRLAINDLSSQGMQPMVYENTMLVCNGEIYNYKELAKQHNITLTSHSDCEIILHLYAMYGLDYTVRALDGPFAFVLCDMEQERVCVARDPIGIRSLYYLYDPDQKSYVFSSEAKGLRPLVSSSTSSFSSTIVQPFSPGHYWTIPMDNLQYSSQSYYPRTYSTLKTMSYVPERNDPQLQWYTSTIRTTLEDAVRKRLLSERPIGCLLSGGVDSSIIAGLVARHFPRGQLHTFSIGLEGSPDIEYARKVAEHIGSQHHEVIVSEHDMLSAIPATIRQIESWDITTIRASVPMYLLSQYIQKHTDIRVIFSGEGSDEASGSYLYFHNSPSVEAFKEETERLLRDLHRFDVLRADKTTAGCGLEVRVPFLDKFFLQEYMSVDPLLKMPSTFGIEKYLLRKSFDYVGEDGQVFLPEEVLWRVKEAFSDGVSGQRRSWYELIQDEVLRRSGFVEPEKVSKEERLEREASYYRSIFLEEYPASFESLIPYRWLPRWSGDQKDPSARQLSVYKAN